MEDLNDKLIKPTKCCIMATINNTYISETVA